MVDTFCNGNFWILSEKGGGACHVLSYSKNQMTNKYTILLLHGTEHAFSVLKKYSVVQCSAMDFSVMQ